MRLTDLTETTGDALRNAGAYLSGLMTPTIRLGVTGLARSGKTVFITALVRNLLAGGRLPFFAAMAEGRIERAYLEPQPDDRLPRFAYEEHLAELAADINSAIWDKFVFLASLAALTAMTRKPLGPILADADTKAMLADAMQEVVAVAAARGVKTTPDVVPKTLKFAGTLPAELKASMAHDLDRGNRIEIEGLSGAVMRLGQAAGVPTPVHRAAYAALKLHAAGTAG
mgnify:CR=1 FL=1